MIDKLLKVKLRLMIGSIITYRKIKYSLVIWSTIAKESIYMLRLFKRIQKKDMYMDKDEYNSIIDNTYIRESRLIEVVRRKPRNFDDLIDSHKEIVELKFELYVRYVLSGYDRCTAARKVDSIVLK